MPEAEVALRSYNLAQLQVVQHEDHKSLLSEAVILPSTSSEERFIDPEAARSFTFDHVTLTPSNYEPYVLPEKEAEFAKLLSASWAKYARNHYPSGVASVSTNQVPVPNAAEAEDNVAATPASEDLASPEAGSSLPGDPVGATELAPTPVVGDKVVSGDDEVDRADGLQKLDKEMEEVKEEEEAEDNATALTPRDEMPSGVIEAEPTPVTGEKALDGTDEVDREGGLENLDGEMEEVKEETEDQREEDTSEREAEVQVVRDLAEQRADVAQREPIVAVEAKPQLKPLDNPTYTLEIVGNKYSPTNYWTGRWRTRWTVEGSTVNGLINVDIHYYEQGNVSCSTPANNPNLRSNCLPTTRRRSPFPQRQAKPSPLRLSPTLQRLRPSISSSSATCTRTSGTGHSDRKSTTAI